MLNDLMDRFKDNRVSSILANLADARFANISFFLLALIVLYAAIYSSLNIAAVVSYTRDIWHHLSVFRELIASSFDAMNPHVATHDPSRSYSPWTMFVAFLARIGGLDAFGAIAISAIISTFTILVGIFLFSRVYMRSAWAPFLMLVVFFGTWGKYVNHTGFHTPATFLYSISYPFAIVLGAGFILWWLVLTALNTSSKRLFWVVLIMALISASMFITHQLQGLFGIAAAGGFALFAGDAPLRRRIIVSGSLLFGLFLSRFWWYFDPIAYVLKSEVRNGHDAVRVFTYSLENPAVMILTIGIAFAGLLGLFNWKTRRVRLELALPLFVIVAGFVLLLVRESWVSTRVLPFIVIFLQVSLVTYLVSDRVKTFGLVGKIVDSTVRVVLILCIALGFTKNWQRGVFHYKNATTYLATGQIDYLYSTWNNKIVEASQFGETLAPKGATVIANRDVAFPMEATSLAVVAIPRLFAEVPDMLERQADNRAFFAIETTTQTRCEILARYDVQLVAYRAFWLEEGVEDQLKALGTAKASHDLSFIPAKDGEFSGCDE